MLKLIFLTAVPAIVAWLCVKIEEINNELGAAIKHNHADISGIDSASHVHQI